VSQESNSRVPRSRKISAAQASLAVTRNTLWNLLGTVLPILTAGVTIPVLIHYAGIERFGVFAIALSLLGYFGFLDLGLGRSTTKFLAEAFEHNRIVEGRAIFWTSIILIGLTGIIGALLLTALTPLLVTRVLNVPVELRSEALGAFHVLALGVPLVSLHAATRGALEAQHRFSLTSTIFVINSMITQVSPLLVLPFTHNLKWLVGALVLSRLSATATFLVTALWHLDNPFEGPFFLHRRLRTLLSYSVWQGITNAISPIMENADRIIIGALSSLSAVAYYSVPAEIVNRLTVISVSFGRTTFPIFSADAAAEQRSYVYAKYSKYLVLLLAPVSASVVVFAPDALQLWLGSSFAKQSALVLQILAVGLLMNSLAMLPFMLIQGIGRADITAKFHLLELTAFLPLLWYGVHYAGIIGASVVWTIRVGADFLLLILYIRSKNIVDVQIVANERLRQAYWSGFLLLIAGWLLQAVTTQPTLKFGIWSGLLVVAVYSVWWRLLTLEERNTSASIARRIMTLVVSRFAKNKRG
jgi:O-antigen/teichoic acid export membrane protein